MTIIGISGSRNITDEKYVFSILEKHIKKDDIILNGGAKTGVDFIAVKWAIKNNIRNLYYLPLFEVDRTIPYNPKHYFARNQQIVDNCDKMLIIWDGQSPGTKYTMEYAVKMDREVILIHE